MTPPKKKSVSTLKGEDAYAPVSVPVSVPISVPVKATPVKKRAKAVKWPTAPPWTGAKDIDPSYVDRAMEALGHDPKCARRKPQEMIKMARYPFDTKHCRRCREIAKTIPKEA